MSGSSNAGAAVAEQANVRESAGAGATPALGEAALFAAMSALIFLAFGLLTLGRGHPEEDAYIMFRYADHVAQGRGIVFNPAGPPAEGATDFLWMIMLSAVELIGFDVAVGAVVLNAIGAALAAFVLAKVIADAGLSTNLRRTWCLLAALTVPFLSSAMAAYGCFSSMLYAGFALFAVHTSLVGSPRAIKWIPAAALALGLFRPDGVILAGGTVVLAALRAHKLRILPAFLLGIAAAGVSGAVYFFWRYSYFGLALPLPLYVKSRVGDIDKLAQLSEGVQALARRMPGLGANLHWLVVGGALASAAAGVVALYLLFRADRSWRKAALRALGALPFALLFASLTFAYQTQNFQWRFQAPIQLAALYFAFRGMSAVTRRGLLAPGIASAFVAVSMLVASWPGLRGIGFQLDPARGGYLNVFAARYGRTLTMDTRAALTEAGRFPFWSVANCLDTIGLNSPEAAVRPVTIKMLTEFDPHVLFFHHAATLDLTPLPKVDPIVRLTSFRPYVLKPLKEAFDRDYEDYKDFPFSSVKLPSLVMEHYLEIRMADFEVYAVDSDLNGTFTNIIAFRKDSHPDRALAELRASMLPESRASYLALAKDRVR
jgi:hypothetical protein